MPWNSALPNLLAVTGWVACLDRLEVDQHVPEDLLQDLRLKSVEHFCDFPVAKEAKGHKLLL